MNKNETKIAFIQKLFLALSETSDGASLLVLLLGRGYVAA